MRLQEQIKKDLTLAMKDRDEGKRDALRVILGEFGRLEKKELSDDEVIKVMKKLLKSERDVLEKGGASDDSVFIQIIEHYLPKMATDEEIIAWINLNIDFSKFKNKMQAMGAIMKHFGAQADGDAAKKNLENM